MLKNSVPIKLKIIHPANLIGSQVERVSVAIVTRNRANALRDCLMSLSQQTVQPAEYIIVDNASTDATAEVILDFSRSLIQNFGNKINVKKIFESRLGYPVVYNRGLKSAKHNWVIFIDDDCVADPEWLRAYLTEIKLATPAVVALVGQSQTLQPATVWSLAVLAMDQFWKHSVIDSNNWILDLETLDNKNLAYFKPFLTQHDLAFNEAALKEPGAGAAEDADLGMQIMQAGGQAKYVAKAQIWHKDPNQMVWFFKRLKAGAVANYYYQKRWLKVRNQLGCLKLRESKKFREFWPKFCHNQDLKWPKNWLVLTIVRISFWLVKSWQFKLVKTK